MIVVVFIHMLRVFVTASFNTHANDMADRHRLLSSLSAWDLRAIFCHGSTIVLGNPVGTQIAGACRLSATSFSSPARRFKPERAHLAAILCGSHLDAAGRAGS